MFFFQLIRSPCIGTMGNYLLFYYRTGYGTKQITYRFKHITNKYAINNISSNKSTQ